jgi:DNA-binding response OmpR family regulator
LANVGTILLKIKLVELVWDMNINMSVPTVAIKRLWEQVDDPFDYDLLRTMRGMRYVFKPRLETSIEKEKT